MMTMTARRRRTLPLAPIIAAMFALAAAVLAFAVPSWRLENAVVTSGLADALSFARPPLGLKARAALVLVAFVVTGGLVWALVRFAERIASVRVHRAEIRDELDLEPFVDRAPGPLETRRKPIFADRELGAPFMSEEVLARPREPEAAVAIVDDASVDANQDVNETNSLDKPLVVDEFDLPPSDSPVEPLPGETSLDALIRRLEAGMARREASRPPEPTTPGPVPITPLGRWSEERHNDDDDGDAARLALGTLRRMVRG